MKHHVTILMNHRMIVAYVFWSAILAGCSGPQQPVEQKVTCRSPNSEKETRVVQWKFDAVREALLKVVPQDEAGVSVRDLPQRIEAVPIWST